MAPVNHLGGSEGGRAACLGSIGRRVCGGRVGRVGMIGRGYRSAEGVKDNAVRTCLGSQALRVDEPLRLLPLPLAPPCHAP